MLKLYKMSQDDVEQEKRLLMKHRPKSKLKKEKLSDPKVKVRPHSVYHHMVLKDGIGNIIIDVKYDCAMKVFITLSSETNIT